MLDVIIRIEVLNWKKYFHWREKANLIDLPLIKKKGSRTECLSGMFGKGVCFADLLCKSAQYCFTDKKNPVGLRAEEGNDEFASHDLYVLLCVCACTCASPHAWSE